ncbi:glycine betaine/L-proline ABC transporter substrate-binding protein ProX [Celerinatantimonas diazotrophica]|uniref:Glycine betaine/proline transport system substrate-binding protein n=1 Tax=Celerinatantimonas diazotrophica TaxID=412034 RepID=A0A4R1K8M9_9GAMM|nr:glycine betaine/L-proline ABC transporter substrate-binding protein ProX [Celerinatantimonas diazotrophica]TCK60347.1 glycine betaine/proline transport system substrate-binding protein [Celerinatantimonas diazotrophica]CAG9295095.1 Glycine betaine-binding periplasmic protein OusX [Celerinatantimonas diazotrophica]
MKLISPHIWLGFSLTIVVMQANAASLPGAGKTVQPIQSTLQEETFQTMIVDRALEKLGYKVNPIKQVSYNVAYTSVANGDATFMADSWEPNQVEKYRSAGGDKVFYRKGVYIANSAQGYMIDKKTADKYHITNIQQLKDPKLAKLFDQNGDGKADLTSCDPGWACSDIINYQLKQYGLSKTVESNSGNYAAIIANTIARYKQGKPILYYAWTPYWVSGVLVPGKDVVWLQVPFSAIPGEPQANTSVSNGKNYGFPMNNQRIVANKKWVQQNPAAGKLFAIMKLNVNDVSAENLMMRHGQSSNSDIQAHADGWIKAHQKTFNHWITVAKQAATK